VRQPGAGRKPVEKKTPEIIGRIRKLLEHDTAGDPISGIKWSRRTPEKIAEALGVLAIEVTANTVARLLKQLGYSLRVNRKNIESGNKNPPPKEVRNRQFEYIAEQREHYAAEGRAIISIDSKKRELVGNFKNAGAAYEDEPEEVFDHDFRSDASGVAIPYGIFDSQANHGFVFVGASHDTPEFAVDCIASWWKLIGRRRYEPKILILADCGGSNSVRARLWKWQLQKVLCDGFGLEVTVSHYPAGCSKYNPIEHRLLRASVFRGFCCFSAFDVTLDKNYSFPP